MPSKSASRTLTGGLAGILISPGQSSSIKVRQVIFVLCVASARHAQFLQLLIYYAVHKNDTCHLQDFMLTSSPVDETLLVTVNQNFFPDGAGLSEYVTAPTGAALQSLCYMTFAPGTAHAVPCAATELMLYAGVLESPVANRKLLGSSPSRKLLSGVRLPFEDTPTTCRCHTQRICNGCRPLMECDGGAESTSRLCSHRDPLFLDVWALVVLRSPFRHATSYEAIPCWHRSEMWFRQGSLTCCHPNLRSARTSPAVLPGQHGRVMVEACFAPL